MGKHKTWQSAALQMMMINVNDSWWFPCVILVLFYRVIVQISHSGQIAKYFTAGRARISLSHASNKHICIYMREHTGKNLFNFQGGGLKEANGTVSGQDFLSGGGRVN